MQTCSPPRRCVQALTVTLVLAAPSGCSDSTSPDKSGTFFGPNAPERKGEPFTATFIYGSFDGAFIFGEPMIARAYLETKPSAVTTAVKLPTQYAVHGYQPTSYTVAYDDPTKEYRIAIAGLVMR